MIMHPTTTRGANGSMELFFQHSESGSGHADDYETITLEGDDDDVVLSISYSSSTVKGSRGGRESRYSISTDSLIDFIKKQGKSI